MREPISVGLSGVAGVLPRSWHTLDELAAAGLLVSTPDSLASLGFRGAHICDPGDGPESMALEAAREALREARLEPDEVDADIWASARADSHLIGHVSANCPSVLGGFRYAAAWLQDRLDLRNADVLAVGQQGCSTMFSALRIARALVLAEPERCRHVLCVGLDALPPAASREILYNVISDGACAVVLSRDCPNDVWQGFRQISQGSFWDPAAFRAEIMASYFPVARTLLRQLLADHELQPDEIDLVVPTGVNSSSWDLLLKLVGLPADRLYRGLASFGHTMTSDTFLFLDAVRKSRNVPAGSNVLLFAFGFGSNWSALLLEH
jgi:3-oxoacyl-[acyl-carrier-protein] synthase-3